MAVKKVNSKSEETKKNVSVEVETPVETQEVEPTVDTDVEETTPEVAEVAEVAEIEVETPNEESENGVEVDTESAEVNTANKPNGKVKIRMRVDHKCCIAMERYDLKAGKTYVVPTNVKNILNKAGLLSPL